MPIDPNQIIRSAMQHHQAGRRREAEALYRQLLGQIPNHGDALHYLGLLVFQDGRVDEGLELMRRAVAAEPSAPHYHANLAHALKIANRIDDAIAAWRKAIARYRFDVQISSSPRSASASETTAIRATSSTQ